MAGRPRSRLRDWLLGGAGKQALLDALLSDRPGERIWQRHELIAAARQHPKARADIYVRPLLHLGLVTRAPGGGYRVDIDSPLAQPLASLLAALQSLPADEIDRPRAR